MESTNWVQDIGIWVAVVTGSVGAVSGILGYRKAASIKKLDLRIEVRKLRDRVSFNFDKAIHTHPDVTKSRHGMARARGRSGSGGLVAWNTKHDARLNSINKLKDDLPRKMREEGLGALSQEELELVICKLHTVDIELNFIVLEMEKDLAEDETHRKELRSEAHARAPQNQSSYVVPGGRS